MVFAVDIHWLDKRLPVNCVFKILGSVRIPVWIDGNSINVRHPETIHHED